MGRKASKKRKKSAREKSCNYRIEIRSNVLYRFMAVFERPASSCCGCILNYK